MRGDNALTGRVCDRCYRPTRRGPLGGPDLDTEYDDEDNEGKKVCYFCLALEAEIERRDAERDTLATRLAEAERLLRGLMGAVGGAQQYCPCGGGFWKHTDDCPLEAARGFLDEPTSLGVESTEDAAGGRCPRCTPTPETPDAERREAAREYGYTKATDLGYPDGYAERDLADAFLAGCAYSETAHREKVAWAQSFADWHLDLSMAATGERMLKVLGQRFANVEWWIRTWWGKSEAHREEVGRLRAYKARIEKCYPEPQIQHLEAERDTLATRLAKAEQLLRECIDVVEDVGPWGENGEQTRVCTECGDAGPDGKPDECAHVLDECAHGRARVFLSSSSTSRCATD